MKHYLIHLLLWANLLFAKPIKVEIEPTVKENGIIEFVYTFEPPFTSLASELNQFKFSSSNVILISSDNIFYYYSSQPSSSSISLRGSWFVFENIDSVTGKEIPCSRPQMGTHYNPNYQLRTSQNEFVQTLPSGNYTIKLNNLNKEVFHLEPVSFVYTPQKP